MNQQEPSKVTLDYHFFDDALDEDDLCKDCALDKKALMLNETGPYFKGREKKDMMDPQNE